MCLCGLKRVERLKDGRLTALFLVEKHSPVHNSEAAGLASDSESDEETLPLVGRRGIEIETVDAVHWHVTMKIDNISLKKLFSSI
jgi:hypothetical protein